ncbi:MAG: transglycosylase SLT domain-containing protein [Proteobacteria bacterium]|nr:transglycosylase SLT domain-containing protein [Pseudomonadota bacterium]
MPNAAPHKITVKFLFLLLPLFAAIGSIHAQAEYASDPFDPVVARNAWLLISEAEHTHNIPPGLLHAISLVETGQGIRGWVLPWPYTVGVNAPSSRTLSGRAAALSALNQWRAMGFVRFDFRAPGIARSNASAAETSAQLSALSDLSPVVLQPRPFSRRFNNTQEAENFAQRFLSSGYTNLDIGMMQINWRVHGSHFATLHQAFNVDSNLAYAVQYLLENRDSGRDWWGLVGRYHSGTAYYANRYIRNVYAMYLRIHRVNPSA